MALLSSLVAKLETPTAQGAKIGTAYPIAQGYIITAYHVFPDIDDLTKTKIIWLNNDASADEQDDGESIERIVYKDQHHDIVIAKCKTPKCYPVRILKNFSEINGRWHSHGYAKSGQDHTKKTRTKDPAWGEFAPHQDDYHIQQLSTEPKLNEVLLWRGMSGAPVFIENTNTLVAIITDTPRKDKSGKAVSDNVLYSTSIPYVYKKCSDFRQAISNCVESKTNEILKKAADFMKAEDLATLFKKEIEEHLPDEMSICQALSIYTVRNFLNLVAQLQASNSNKCMALGQLVCVFLPYLFDEGKAKAIRDNTNDSGCPIVLVPHASETIVEFLMAKVDYREADFIRLNQSSSKAKYRLPLFPDSADEKEVLEKSIVDDAYNQIASNQQKLVLAKVTRRLFDGDKDCEGIIEKSLLSSDEKTEKEKIDFVRDALEDRFEDGEARYYFLINTNALGIENNDDGQIEEFSTALKEIYPHCPIVYCNSDHERQRQELRDYRKLIPILSHYIKTH